MSTPMERPHPDEYFEYYRTYVDLVDGDDVLKVLDSQIRRLVSTFAKVPSEHETFAYAPDKWSVREVLGHINDAERVFSYRGLSVGRGDPTPLPGFDENEWAQRSNAGSRPLGDLLDEFQASRAATLALYRSFDASRAALRGTASDRPTSVRALAWITAGHAEHHLRIHEERYVPAMK